MRNKPKRCLKYKGPGDCKNCTPKPAPAKRPWVSSLKHPYIWLESLDSIGRADCGCVLVANHENSGDPAFFQCPLHDAAPILKYAIKAALDAVSRAPNGKPAHRIVTTMVEILQRGLAAERKA